MYIFIYIRNKQRGQAKETNKRQIGETNKRRQIKETSKGDKRGRKTHRR